MNQYKTVYIGGTGEIIEKKSRFIANVIPISSEEEALSFIEDMKKKYWDASHNCSAYVLFSNPELQRCSDDGEPAKTAGRPMLDVLINEGIRNTAIVVTRYFGGTLLGTGGLVRAYTQAARCGLESSVIIEKKQAKKLSITTDYSGIGKLQYIAGQLDLPLIGSEYLESVTTELVCIPDKEGVLRKKINEATNGAASITVLSDCYYCLFNGNVVLFSQ